MKNLIIVISMFLSLTLFGQSQITKSIAIETDGYIHISEDREMIEDYQTRVTSIVSERSNSLKRTIIRHVAQKYNASSITPWEFVEGSGYRISFIHERVIYFVFVSDSAIIVFEHKQI